MPFITAKVVKGVMLSEEKQRLAERLTDAVVEVFARGNESFRPNIWVVVEEVDAFDWTVGGVPVDLATARKLTGRG
ncbi:MAG: 4-oxalocrotonate tautomerase family protein [Chloroflexi bacterium]|nr:4-oxalocrotonate tautomerase family protein [Chloroflexota bacterium]